MYVEKIIYVHIYTQQLVNYRQTISIHIKHKRNSVEIRTNWDHMIYSNKTKLISFTNNVIVYLTLKGVYCIYISIYLFVWLMFLSSLSCYVTSVIIYNFKIISNRFWNDKENWQLRYCYVFLNWIVHLRGIYSWSKQNYLYDGHYDKE